MDIKSVRIKDPNGENFRTIIMPVNPSDPPLSEEDGLLVRMQFKIDYLESKLKHMDDVNTWRLALVKACEDRQIPFNERNPRETLKQIITHDVKRALNPHLSASAQKLVNVGYTMAFSDTNPGHATGLGALTDLGSLE